MSLLPAFFDDHGQRLYRWLRSVCFYEHWMIGIIDQPIANALTWTSMPPVRWIEPFTHKYYRADPFPWPGSDDTIVCEEYGTDDRVGRLVALKLGPEGVAGKIDMVFSLPGHLSFPALYLIDGQLYAMPESCSARRLEIFRWREDTASWASHHVVFDNVPAADAVLFETDRLFWILYTDVTEDPHDNLHLIYASALTGPWIAHPANPVQRGRDHCRNGGKIFEVNGKLYRPAQDCSHVYGGALRLMEIVTCTSTEYVEKEAAFIPPSSKFYRDGCHTLSAWGDKCLMDGMRLVFSWGLLAHKLRRRIGR